MEKARSFLKKVFSFCRSYINGAKGMISITLVLALCAMLSMTVSAAESNQPVSAEDDITIYEDVDEQDAGQSESTAPADMAEDSFIYSDVTQSIEKLLFGLDVTQIVDTLTEALSKSSIKELFALAKNLYKSVVDYVFGLTGNEEMSETVGNAMDAAEQVVIESDEDDLMLTQQTVEAFGSQTDITEIFGSVTGLFNGLIGMFTGA